MGIEIGLEVHHGERCCHHGENGSFGHDYNNAPPFVWTLRWLFFGGKVKLI